MICGVNAVRAALETDPASIHRIVVEKGRKDARIGDVLRLATHAGIPVNREPRAALDRLAEEVRHQGVVAVLAEAPYAELGSVVDEALSRRADPVIVALDGINDPHNLGAVARTAECVGAVALVVPRHGSAAPGAAAHRASAGALSRIPLCRVTNLSRALRDLKERGFWVVGSGPAGEDPPWKLDLTGPLVVVIGGEENGMRPGVARMCDFVTTIPTPGATESLNASVAAGMILFEMLRQRSVD